MPMPLVDEHTPPTFIYHTSNDELVPAAGSAEFFEALIAHHVPAELHSFEIGLHGSGLGGASSALSTARQEGHLHTVVHVYGQGTAARLGSDRTRHASQPKRGFRILSLRASRAHRSAARGGPLDRMLQQLHVVRIRIGLRPMSDGRIKRPAGADASSPDDRVIAHVQILTAHTLGRVSRFIQGRNDVRT